MAGIRDRYRDWAEHRERYKSNPETTARKLKRYRERGGQRAANARYIEKLKADPERYAAQKEIWRLKAIRYRDKLSNKMRLLLKRHKISLEEYRFVVARQGPGCGICRRTHVILHLDHCHQNGHMRGLLCQNCNLGIGRLGDNIEGLERALKYMRENF
jgi:hypothetical protein